MFLENIRLYNFKNYTETTLSFSPKINAIVGDNGSGKTNLLDAIHYLSLSKSAFNAIDSQNIKHNEINFSLQGNIKLAEENYKILCAYQQGQKKVLKVNHNAYERILEHVGRFPVVLIAPNDSKLISEGSEERRRFFDSIISQLNRAYLEDLVNYNRVLKQRNAHLKTAFDNRNFDTTLLSVYDESILNLGVKIAKARQEFIIIFKKTFHHIYQFISDKKESTDLVYQSDFIKDDYRSIFKNARNKDISLERTTRGIHKDDYVFKIEDYPLKKFASQGQQKSFLIALKLSHFNTIEQEKQLKPILLLDDIFDKLDDNRIKKLIDMVADDKFGQIFITDARPERTSSLLNPLSTALKIINTKTFR